MRPGTYHLDLYRGDTFAWRFRLWDDEAKTEPSDLTGVEVNAQVRNMPGGEVVMSIACEVTLPNIIDARLEATEWDSFDECARQYGGAWDLELLYPATEEHSAAVVTVLAGSVVVSGDVTRTLAEAVV